MGLQRGLGYAAAGLAVAAAAAVAWAFGPGAPMLVEAIADGRTVWRLGKLDLDDVRGASLGDLRIGAVSLADARGVWFEARDVRLEWRPLSLLTGAGVRVAAVQVARAEVKRRPQLSAPPPDRNRPPRIEITRIAAPLIAIGEDVAGAPAVFALSGGLAATPESLRRLNFTLARQDRPGDLLSIDWRDERAFTASLALSGARDGVFAGLLGVEGDISARGDAEGGANGGKATLKATVGGAPLAQGGGAWSRAGAEGKLALDLGAVPAFSALTDRVGGRIELGLRAQTGGAKGGGARLEGEAKSASAALSFGGPIDYSGGGAIPRIGLTKAPWAVTFRTAMLENLLPGLSAGSGVWSGEAVSAGEALRLTGKLDARALTPADVRLRLSGPVSADISAARVSFSGELNAPADEISPARIRRLAEGLSVRLTGAYDRAAATLAFDRLAVSGKHLRFNGAGRITPVSANLSGDWRLPELRAVDERADGAARGRWSAARPSAAAPWAISVEGQAERFRSSQDILTQLAGAAPRVEAALSIGGPAIALNRLVVTSPKLRWGARGAIREGALDLSYESSIRGPVRIGDLEIAGVGDATGAISGRFEAPRITARARFASLDVGGAAIAAPVIDVSLQGGAKGFAGGLEAEGVVAGTPVRMTSPLSLDAEGMRFDRIAAESTAFSAAGRASFGPAGVNVALDYSSPLARWSKDGQGALAGRLQLTGTARAPLALHLTGAANRARLGGAALSRLDFAAEGPLENLALSAQIAGRTASAPFAARLTGQAKAEDTGVTAALELSGQIADAPVASARPVTVRLGRRTTAADAELRLGDGGLSLSWREQAGAVDHQLRLTRAPLAPLLALAGERGEGAITGQASLSGAGARLGANARFEVKGALLRKRARDPLDFTIDAAIRDGRLVGDLRGLSRNGLDAAVRISAPVAASVEPLRIALAGEGRAEWRARGPAEALWTAFGGLDQSVGGEIDGAGVARFTTDTITGDGGFSLSGGRFQDRRAGLDLRDISARVTFDAEGARLTAFSARDGRGGTLTATGEARGAEAGKISLIANRIRLIDQPEARATASGPLSLSWQGDQVSVSGDLRLVEASLSPPRGAALAIPVLAVEEINRPTEDAPPPQPARRAAPPPLLDVRIRGDEHVLLRGRGLDSEWAVDLGLRGSAADPRLYGTARLLRGRFTLAGRPFEAERGLIRFNGHLDEALLDIAATRQADGVTARVDVTGTVEKPEVALSSTPALPEDEILPQTLFGRSLADLSAVEAAQLAASLAELSGQAALDIAGAARQIVGLDRIDVREDGAAYRIAGGKYLTRDVYFELGRSGLGEPTSRLEWRVRPQLLLITAFEPNGDRRVSLRWRRDY